MRDSKKMALWPTPRALEIRNSDAHIAERTQAHRAGPGGLTSFVDVVEGRIQMQEPPNHSISFPRDSLAKTCPQPESKQASTVSEVVYGQSAPELLASYDTSRQSFLSKTYQPCLLENPEHGDDEFLETLPKSFCMEISPTESKAMLYRLETLMDVYLPERLTDENAHGLWPTPNTMDSMKGRTPEELKAQAGKNKGRWGPNLNTGNLRDKVMQKTWPTPTSRDHKDTGDCANVPVNGLLGRSVGPSKAEGSLSPTWVCWLMGLPLDWLDIDGWQNPELDGLPPEYLTELRS